ncbi:MAG: hypothetical protein GY847_01350 [Proteobacteria bacterium]|nr:hypothetical protein [Pseudomonadota bacterium]
MAARVYMEFQIYSQTLAGLTFSLVNPTGAPAVETRQSNNMALIESPAPVQEATGIYYAEIDESLYEETETYFHRWDFNLGYGSQRTEHYFRMAAAGVLVAGGGGYPVEVTARQHRVGVEVGVDEVSVSTKISRQVVASRDAGVDVETKVSGRNIKIDHG